MTPSRAKPQMDLDGGNIWRMHHNSFAACNPRDAENMAKHGIPLYGIDGFEGPDEEHILMEDSHLYAHDPAEGSNSPPLLYSIQLATRTKWAMTLFNAVLNPVKGRHARLHACTTDSGEGEWATLHSI